VKKLEAENKAMYQKLEMLSSLLYQVKFSSSQQEENNVLKRQEQLMEKNATEENLNNRSRKRTPRRSHKWYHKNQTGK